jgi:hypothetical protein
MTKLSGAFGAFLIALAGIGLAIIFFYQGFWCATVVVVPVALLGWLCDLIARRLVLYRFPVAAVCMMELWVLFPAAIVAAAAAAVIVINVNLKPEQGSTLSLEEKEIYSALVTALTAFLTVGLLKSAEDIDENWIAPHVRAAFQAKYRREPANPAQRRRNVYYYPVPADEAHVPEVEKWVHREAHGGAISWKFSDRHRRAQGVSQALK